MPTMKPSHWMALCRKCAGSRLTMYLIEVDCSYCVGTGWDPIPEAELFKETRNKRRWWERS